MARNENKHLPSGTGKVKFRVVEFEMEGGNDRIEQGLRAFAQAVVRANEVTIPRNIAPTRQSGSPSLDAGDASDDVPVDLEVDATAVEAPEFDSDATTSKPKRRSAPKAPKFLSNLDLTTSETSLSAFVTSKDPKDTQEKYIVISVWLKEFLNTDEFSVDHIFTAYKHLGWTSQLPSDPSQPLRDLRYKKNWLDGGSAKGTFKVNWSGTNHVNKMGSSKNE